MITHQGGHNEETRKDPAQSANGINVSIPDRGNCNDGEIEKLPVGMATLNHNVKVLQLQRQKSIFLSDAIMGISFATKLIF